MTLPNTRAAGLRQAAEAIKAELADMDSEFHQERLRAVRRVITTQMAPLRKVASLLDRMAQEAEENE